MATVLFIYMAGVCWPSEFPIERSCNELEQLDPPVNEVIEPKGPLIFEYEFWTRETM